MIGVNVHFHRAAVLNDFFKLVSDHPIKDISNVVRQQVGDLFKDCQFRIQFIENKNKLSLELLPKLLIHLWDFGIIY